MMKLSDVKGWAVVGGVVVGVLAVGVAWYTFLATLLVWTIKQVVGAVQ